MPGRKVPLIDNQIYHIFNRGVASQPTFTTAWEYKRAIEAMFYYQNIHPPLKYSLFLKQAREKREEILSILRKRSQIWAEIITYCLIPNHFHLLLRQKIENGISKFLGNFTNSYTRYFNTKHDREGHLFKGKFRAIRIETDEQLLHVSRYIHLNPHSSYVVKDLKELVDYPYSSLPEYLGKTTEEHCHKHKKLVLGNFPSKKDYQKFVFDQADYQRSLEEIKHLRLEK